MRSTGEGSIDDFVGRRDLLRRLATAADSTARGTARVVVLDGEPGIGKSRLLREALRRTRLPEPQVHVTRCYEDAEGSTRFLRTLRAALAQAELIAPTLAERWTADPEAYADATIELARIMPLALGVDDLQWADPPALEFLEVLVDRCDAPRLDRPIPLLVILAAREETSDEAQRALERIHRHGVSARIRLAGLSEDECVEMIRSSTLGTAAERHARPLREITRGNPLLLGTALEILEQAQDEGGLDVSSMSDQVLARLELPQDVQAAAERLLLMASPECRRVLEVAALVTAPVTPTMLAHLMASSVDKVIEALDKAESIGLIGVDTGTVRFAYAAYRVQALDELTSLRRAQLRDTITTRLEELHLSGDAAALAILAEEATSVGSRLEPSRVHGYVSLAADQAMHASEWRRASRLYESALATAVAADATADELARLTMQAGLAAFHIGDDAAAIDRLNAAVERFAALRDHRGELDALLHQIGIYERSPKLADDVDGAAALGTLIDALEGHLDQLDADEPALAAEARGQLSMAAAVLGDDERANRWAMEAAARIDDLRSPQSLTTVHGAMASAKLIGADPVPAVRHFDEAARASLALGSSSQLDVRYMRPLAHLMSGDLAGAQDAARDLLTIARAANKVGPTDQGLGVQAAVALLQGDPVGAERLADECRGLFARHRRTYPPMFLYPTLLVLYGLQGRRVDIETAVEEWSSLDPRDTERIHVQRIFEALAHAQAGEHTRAAAIADGLVGHVLERPLLLTVPAVAAAFVEVGWLLDMPRLATTGAALVDEALARGQVLGSTGAQLLHVASAAAAALHGEPDQAIATLDDAREIAGPWRAPTARAMIELRHAEIAERAGRLDEAIVADATRVVTDLGLPGLTRRLARLGVSVDLERPIAGRVERFVLMADVAGSTALTAALGDRTYKARLEPLLGILRGAVAAAGGETPRGRNLGDGILALFEDGTAAVDAALRSLAGASATGLDIHVGIHYGPLILEGHNTLGATVNTAARYCDAAEAGELFVSPVVRDALAARTDIDLVDRGSHEMKGLSGAQQIIQVVPRGAT